MRCRARDHPDLPLLISCRHVNGRIRHLFTSFDERNPDATGNRYLICFTSEKQAKKAPSAPVVDDRQHADRPDFSNLEERYPSGKRRKKGVTITWMIEAGETTRVSTEKVLSYVRHSRAVGGITASGIILLQMPLDSGGIASLCNSHEEDVHMSQIPRQKLRLGNMIDHILYITYSLF